MADKFYIVTILWGKDYIETFLRCTIPSLLCDGNLKSFKYREDSTYLIFTLEDDWEIIRKSPIIKELKKYIRINANVCGVSGYTSAKKYILFTRMYNDIIKMSYDNNTTIILLQPDIIVSNNLLKNIAKIYDSGKKVILNNYLTANRKQTMEIVLNKYYNKKTHSIDIPPRELVDIAMNNLQGLFKHVKWDNMKGDDLWAAMALWKVNNEGYVFHIHHTHPLMICPCNYKLNDKETVDGWQYVTKACPDFDDIYIIQDSDELFVCPLDKKDYRIDCWGKNKDKTITEDFKLNWYIDWARDYSNTYQRKIFQHTIKIHNCDMTENKWTPVEKRANEIVDKILKGTKGHIALTEG